MKNSLVERMSQRELNKQRAKERPYDSTDDGYYWWQLHSGDFLQKTSLLSPEAVGCFTLLTVHLIRHPFIPKDESAIKLICKNADSKSIGRALKMLEENETGYYSSDISKHRIKVHNKAIQRAIAGQKGALARWNKS